MRQFINIIKESPKLDIMYEGESDNVLISFSNELGNQVVVLVEDKELDGVKGILVSIEGPDSDMTSHITREEAVELHKALGDFLTPRQ